MIEGFQNTGDTIHDLTAVALHQIGELLLGENASNGFAEPCCSWEPPLPLPYSHLPWVAVTLVTPGSASSYGRSPAAGGHLAAVHHAVRDSTLARKLPVSD